MQRKFDVIVIGEGTRAQKLRGLLHLFCQMELSRSLLWTQKQLV